MILTKTLICNSKAETFSDRHKGHQKKAKTCFSTAKFYTRYSLIHCQNSSTKCKDHFEDIKMFYAVGFNIDDVNGTKRLVSTSAKENMFMFEKYDEGNINKMNLQGKNMYHTKVTTMISCLIQLKYDLMISSLDNVSVYPEFESCRGVW